MYWQGQYRRIFCTQKFWIDNNSVILMDRKNIIYQNIIWLFFDKILRILGGLFIGIWLARYLGPNDFGTLSYAMAFTGFFLVFVKLGFDQIIIREIVRKPKLTPYFLGTAFGLKLVGSIVALLAVYLSMIYIEMDGLKKTIIFIISAGFIFQAIDVVDYFYQAKVLSKYIVITRNIAFIFSSALKVYFILNEYSVAYFALASVIEIMLAGMLFIIIYKRTGGYINQWRYSHKIAMRLLKFSWPIALSTFLISIHLKIDQVMIGEMLNTEQVGIYSVAVRLAEFWMFMPVILVSTLLPYFINLREQNKGLYHYRLMQLYSLIFWMGICVGLITIIFGQDLIKLLFGVSYIGAYEALVFNIWAGVFMAQSAAKGIWVISENKQLYRVIANMIAIIINISLNVILIPKYGISGAAAATLITRFSNNWVTPIFIPIYRENTIISIKSINPFYVYSKRSK